MKVNIPASTVSVPASTVSVPASTVSVPASTVNVPASTVDVSDNDVKVYLKSLAGYAVGKVFDVETFTWKDAVTIPPSTVIWYVWAKENEKVTLPTPAIVRYGTTLKFFEKQMSGTFTADNITFGDPAIGEAKVLMVPYEKPPVVVEPPPPPPPPPPTGTVINIIAVNYGVKADGTTDNSIALNKISLEQRGKADVVDIDMPTGVVAYTDISWPKGMLKFNIINKSGGRTGLKSTGGNEWFVSHDTFSGDGLFYPLGIGTGQSGLLPFAQFKTAGAGQNQIAVKTLLDISKFPKGRYILLEGFETQGQGWPINPRFFEWKKIADVNTTTGTITFTEPLEHSYNENWKDWTFPDDATKQWGKPRIHLIDQYYPILAKLTNLDIIPQVGFLGDANNRSAFHIGADTLECDNVDFKNSNVWPTINRIAKYNNVRNGAWEIDKLVGYMEMTNSNTPGLWGGTGCKRLVLKNTILNSFSPMTPHNLFADKVTFGGGNGVAALYAFEFWTGCNKWEIGNSIFPLGIQPFSVPTIDLTVGDVSGNSFTLPSPANWDAIEHRFTKLCYHGSQIWNADKTIVIQMNDVIFQNGVYVVQFTPIKGTITKGLKMFFRQVKEIIDLGGNKKTDGTPIILK
jgi:hypothetical protein